MENRISVILPTLAQSPQLHNIRLTLQRSSYVQEVILVMPPNCKHRIDSSAFPKEQLLFSKKTGRGFALVEGIKRASGAFLLFLHDDTLLPTDWDILITNTLQDQQTVGGAFRMKFDPEPRLLYILRKLGNAFTYLTHEFWGDHALFVKRQLVMDHLELLEVPLMEDIRLSSLMRRQGKTTLLDQYVTTSSIRFLEKGIVHQSLSNVLFRTAYALGTDPSVLFRWYHPNNESDEARDFMDRRL